MIGRISVVTLAFGLGSLTSFGEVEKLDSGIGAITIKPAKVVPLKIKTEPIQQPPRQRPVVFLCSGVGRGDAYYSKDYTKSVYEQLRGTVLEGARIVLLPGIDSVSVER